MAYLDYAATSIKRRDVLENLINNLEDFDGNPSSTHNFGRQSNKYLEEARLIIANAINAKPSQIFFTSGASESNNTVVKHFDNPDYEIITSNIEHKSILEPFASSSAKAIFLQVGQNGYISLDEIKSNITENTKLLSLTYVNNETGVTQPLKEIGQYLKDKGIHFHVDAVQALGHIDIDVEEINCDSMSLSGHKIGGMNGFGILYTKSKLSTLIEGGSQEHGQRAGTSNLLGAMSMANSLEKINSERKDIQTIKKYLLDSLRNKEIPFEINGEIDKTSDHIANIYFPFVKSDLLLTFLDMNGFYLSAGSACLAGTLEASYVIENMYDRDRAERSVRFSFGFTNTKEEIDLLTDKLSDFYERKR